MPTIAITPPTMIAEIGTSSAPKPKTESMSRFTCASMEFSGGADRDRTGGLLVANQALSQLSYSPTASKLQVSRILKPDLWWAWIDLNYRPHPYQWCALDN